MSGQYFLLEDVFLTPEQAAVIWALVDESGDENDSQFPNLRNHWAIRPDGKARIYEGVFSDLTIGTMTSRLAQAGVLNQNVAPVPACIYGVQYNFETKIDKEKVVIMRWIIFDAVSTTLEESHAAALLYLSDYKDLWGGVTIP